MQKQHTGQILLGILSPPAYERLGRLKLYNPELHKKIEIKLIGLYNSGQIREQISENKFVEIVDSFKEEKKGFQFVRRQNFSDLDDF
ncbi:Apoptosis-related protein/predicted DNA-binding protein [Pseudoloma neurophilia]|uniref:Apoptosis-related protein/predicted DNA-binding protein n=1 Tax=Pseudoloma neurophilia TaxID=146866 RepID=A0A0R0M3F2_9MICR|nr:Apoptosis-related protein/predicted DNA-binding protein [Pseudoloma neurophilia]